MKPTLQPGLRHTLDFVVPAAKTTACLYPESHEFVALPPVLATGYLVGLLEWACMRALDGHLDPHEQTLGTHVAVSHAAATPPGFAVRASVELVEVDGRRLVFEVLAHDGVDEISRGRHERCVIDRARFDARLRAKAAAPR